MTAFPESHCYSISDGSSGLPLHLQTESGDLCWRIKLNGDIVINNGDSRNFSFTLRSYESITITDLSGVTIRLSNTEFPIRTSSQTIN